jgi:hypothetical protein
MAKKKSKKKQEKKKVNKKKDFSKKKNAKNKKAKKKDVGKKKKSMVDKSVRKKAVKNESRKEKTSKERVRAESTIVDTHPVNSQETEKIENIGQVQKGEPLVANEADKSLNYNVQEAVKKLKGLRSMEEALAFTKGDTRVTVNRAMSTLQRLSETN